MGGCISLEAVLLALSDQVYIFELHWGIIRERLWSLQNSGRFESNHPTPRALTAIVAFRWGATLLPHSRSELSSTRTTPPSLVY